MSRTHARRARVSRLVSVVILTVALAAAACRGTPTPPPTPSPSPTPTGTPDPVRAIEEAVFTISVDGVLLGVETLRLGEEAEALLAFGELVHNAPDGAVERRTVVLSEALNPLRYDLEISALGARSIWVGERTDETMSCLNNNLAWFGPVLTEGIAPAPDVMFESAPSALAFALLALRDYGPQGLQGTLPVHGLDIMADLPASRALTLTVNIERQGAVIGTVAVEGRWEGEAQPAFTMWVRPGTRALYSVEMPAHRLGLWAARQRPDLNPEGTVIIQRVSAPPELGAPSPTSAGAQREEITFSPGNGATLSGTLITPGGSGPYPCLVLRGPTGVETRWDPRDAAARRGWAVLTYDKRGLGKSEGEYERDRPAQESADALAAAAWLRGRPEIDSDRIVLLGLGAGGWAAAYAAGAPDAYAAVVLAAVPGPGPVFPNLAVHRIQNVLAPHYDWSAEQAARYTQQSVTRWQELLFDDIDEVTYLRRRVSLRPLYELSDLDVGAALAAAVVPVLLLQGAADAWVPAGSAQALAAYVDAPVGRLAVREFPGLDRDLGRGSDPAMLLAPEVDEALFAWLDETLGR